jgi:Domain of Unknown Function (DUF1080)
MRLLSLLILLAAVGPASAQWKLDDKFKVLKPEDLKDAVGTPAPKDAIVLFDGKSADKWTKRDGKKVEWKIADGAMEGFKGHGDIVTKEKFDGKFKLHVEFRIPYEPDLKQGQGRGNSGVYVQGRYEVQVLDSYGLESKNNDCAAIYEVVAPSKNVCKAPTVWQSYDIEFTAPKFENGKKTEPVRMTVYHNGVKVHDGAKVNVDNTRAGMGGDPATAGPILLQDHGHPVQYRNIWLLK